MVSEKSHQLRIEIVKFSCYCVKGFFKYKKERLMTPIVEAHHLVKKYGDFEAVKDASEF